MVGEKSQFLLKRRNIMPATMIKPYQIQGMVELMKKVEELEKRVEELEDKKKNPDKK